MPASPGMIGEVPIKAAGCVEFLGSPAVLIEVCANVIARDGLPFPASLLGAVTRGRGGHPKDTTDIATPAP